MIAAWNAAAEAWLALVWSAAWQAGLVALVILALVHGLRRLGPHARYLLLGIALLKFFTPPFLSLPTGLFGQLRWEPAARETAPPPRVPAAVLQPSPRGGEPAPVSLSPEETPRANDPPRVASVTPAPTPASGSPLQAPSTPVPWALLAVLLQALGSTVASLLLLRSWRSARALRGPPVSDPAWRDRLTQLAGRVGIRAPRLHRAASPEGGPFTMGLWRPVLAVPTALLDRDDPTLRDAVLLHELAHLRRRDPWVNALQHLATVTWWFHPLLWCLQPALRQAREQCTDADVVRRGWMPPVTYCESLLTAARTLTRPPRLLVAMAGPEHSLAERLRSVMSRTRRDTMSWTTRLAVSALGLLLLPGLADPSAALPQESAAGTRRRAAVGPAASVEQLRESDRVMLAAIARILQGQIQEKQGSQDAHVELLRRKEQDLLEQVEALRALVADPPRPMAVGPAGAPDRTAVTVPAEPDAAWLPLPKEGGTVAGRLRDAAAAPLAGALVLLKVEGRRYEPPREPAVLEARDGAFYPRVLLARQGQEVILRNRSDGPANFHLLGHVNREHNLLVPPGDGHQLKLQESELIPVQSARLPDARAWLLVTSHPWVAVTDAEGRFTLPGAPAGTFDLDVWHEHAGRTQFRVRVTQGETHQVELVMPAAR